MPLLQVLEGPGEGTLITLEGDCITLGRDPGCTVVIPVTNVSREHAQILRLQNRFFIEDLQSRNGTFVNNVQINARTQLKNNDRIRICDFLAAFQDSPFPPLPEATATALRSVVPEYGSVGNPLDITGQGVFEPQLAGGSIEHLAQAGNLDIIVWALDWSIPLGPVREILTVLDINSRRLAHRFDTP